MPNYKFERVTADKYQDLLFIMKAAFGVNHGIEYYKHKFNTDYLGVKHLGFLAYDESRQPAAFYGVFPYMMEYNGKKYLAAQSGDTMTHPNHSGKGLFTTLAKMTYELAKKEGIQFIFGFPNENSYPGFVKRLNWIHRENMTNYEWNVATFPCAGLAKRFPFLSPAHRLYTNLVLSFFKATNYKLANSAISADFGGVERSSSFFKYKSFYHNFLTRIGDRTAWIKVDGALLIGDIEVKELNDINNIQSELRQLAFWLGCNKIIFAVGKNTHWDLLLKGKVASREGIYIGYVDLQSNLPLEKFKYVMADMDTF